MTALAMALGLACASSWAAELAKPLTLDQLQQQNGKAIDTEDFVKELRKMLRKPPYNLVCKVIPHGLGRCQLIIGDK